MPGPLVGFGTDVDTDALYRRIVLLERFSQDPSNVNIGGGSYTGGTFGAKAKLAGRYARLGLPNRLNYRQLMASPPTPTFTTAHTIASPQLWGATSGEAMATVGGSFFTFGRAGGFVSAGTTYPDYNFLKGTSVNYGTSGQGKIANSFQVSFYHDGAAIEVFVKGAGGSLILRVDDQYLTATPQAIPNDGNLYYYYVNFGSAKPRRIDVQMAGLFGGVFTAASDTIIPAGLRGPRCIVLGDSFTEAVSGAASPVQGYVDYFADAMGWDDVWKSGVGSTGYLAAPGGKLTFRQRLSTDVTPFNPDMVLVCGGINDSATSQASIQAEATALYAAIQSALPLATIVVASPFWRSGAGSMSINDIVPVHEGVKAAALAAGLPYVDLLEQPLPLNFTPNTATLQSNSSGTITVDKAPVLRSTYKFPNGDRFQVRSFTGTGPYVITPDQAFNNPHFAGDVITQVGDSFWTGNGKVGATTGYGNSDLYVSSDGTHPSPAGQIALGQALAAGVLQVL